jgi:hypothetical protein
MDPLLGGVGQGFVVQQQQVHIQEGRQLTRRIGRQVALQILKLLGDRIARRA